MRELSIENSYYTHRTKYSSSVSATIKAQKIFSIHISQIIEFLRTFGAILLIREKKTVHRQKVRMVIKKKHKSKNRKIKYSFTKNKLLQNTSYIYFVMHRCVTVNIGWEYPLYTCFNTLYNIRLTVTAATSDLYLGAQQSFSVQNIIIIYHLTDVRAVV